MSRFKVYNDHVTILEGLAEYFYLSFYQIGATSKDTTEQVIEKVKSYRMAKGETL